MKDRTDWTQELELCVAKPTSNSEAERSLAYQMPKNKLRNAEVCCRNPLKRQDALPGTQDESEQPRV